MKLSKVGALILKVHKDYLNLNFHFLEELGALRKLSNSRFGLTDADVTKTSSSNLAKFIKYRHKNKS